MSDTLNFLHQIMGSPTKTTFLNAIRNNNLSTWPLFTENNIAKFPTDSIPTALGHQDWTRKTHSILNNQYTKYQKVSTSTSTQQSTSQRCPQGRYTPTKPDDFPSNQAVGKKYIMVIYAYDPNPILVEPLPDRSKESIMKAYQKSSRTSQREVSIQDYKY